MRRQYDSGGRLHNESRDSPPAATAQGPIAVRLPGNGSLFDVINGPGVLTYRVRVPEGWTLVAFGNGTAYTIKHDADDLVYLQRHRSRS